MPVQPYAVIPSKERPFTFVRKLRNLIIFTLILLVASAILLDIYFLDLTIAIAEVTDYSLLMVITALLVILGFVKSFLIPGLVITLLFAILLHVAIKKNWAWPVWIVAPLTFLSSTLILSVIVTVIIRLTIDVHESGANFVTFYEAIIEFGFGSILFMALVFFGFSFIIYEVVHVNYSVRSIMDLFHHSSDSVRYENGLIIEDANENDIETVSEIYFQVKSKGTGLSSKRSTIKEFVDQFDEETEVRIARVPGAIAGFLMGSVEHEVIGIICVSDGFEKYRVKECLVQDFVRRLNKTASPVSTVQVAASNDNLQKKLLEHGWTVSNKVFKRSTDILFEYK